MGLVTNWFAKNTKKSRFNEKGSLWALEMNCLGCTRVGSVLKVRVCVCVCKSLGIIGLPSKL